MNTQELLSFEKAHGARNYTPIDVMLTRGEGVWVYDGEGCKYLDGLSAYSALNQGHCHPRLVKVMVEQVQRLTLTSRAFHNDQYPLLLQRLSQLTGYDAALPMNSGVEAVETALKLARKWAYTVKGVPLNQAEIIVAEHNFHGRTITALSCSTENLYREYFGPYTPGFVSVPYGDSSSASCRNHAKHGGHFVGAAARRSGRYCAACRVPASRKDAVRSSAYAAVDG